MGVGGGNSAGSAGGGDDDQTSSVRVAVAEGVAGPAGPRGKGEPEKGEYADDKACHCWADAKGPGKLGDDGRHDAKAEGNTCGCGEEGPDCGGDFVADFVSWGCAGHGVGGVLHSWWFGSRGCLLPTEEVTPVVVKAPLLIPELAFLCLNWSFCGSDVTIVPSIRAATLRCAAIAFESSPVRELTRYRAGG